MTPVDLHIHSFRNPGIGSSLTIKGLSLGVEDCLSKVTPWPKEVDTGTSLKMLGQHLMLKCVR